MFNRSDTISKVVNLANNLNVKMRSFKKAGYGEQYSKPFNAIKNKYEHKATLATKGGMLSKSVKEISKLSDEELNDLYATMKNLQHSNSLGTVKKYEKLVEKKHQAFEDAFERITGSKPTFKNKAERYEYYKALEENARSGNIKQSDQIILEVYASVNKDENMEEIEEVIRKQRDSYNRLQKYKVQNDIPKRGGNKR